MKLLFNRLNNLFYKNKLNFVLNILLIGSIIIGLIFRIKGLGKWPLAIDEYYIVKSVQNILSHGLPEFPNGGFYERGILYQYLTAGLFLLGIKIELAVRIIPVFTNIITIVPLYLFVKKISSKELASIIVFVFCFSVWEVEFARFGRMYSQFQFLFVLYIYFFYKILFENDKKSIKWLLVISFTSIFVYEASIFLAVINFLPFIWERKDKTFNISKLWKRKENVKYVIISILILVIAILFLTIKFRFIGVSNSLPADFVVDSISSTGGRVRLPLLLISHLRYNKIWILFFLIPLIVSLFTAYNIFKNSFISVSAKYSLLFLLFLSIINLFGFLFFLLISFLLINWLSVDALKKSFKLPIFTVVLNFTFWSAFAVSTISWHSFFPLAKISGVGSSLNFIWKEFINYPYLYETFVLFRDTIPYFTFITIFLFLFGILLFIKINNHRYKFLLFIFLFLILQISFLNLTYFKTRYFFFLHPLIIILDFSIIFVFLDEYFSLKWLRRLIFIIVGIMILFFSEDFDLNHVYNIDSEKINFRQGMNRMQKDHYYPRWDVRTPAEIINKNVQKDDIVIVTEQINEFYLKKQDYMYEDSRAIDFSGVSILNGTKERWTNSKLIYNNLKFIDLIKNTNTTKWVVINTIYGTRFMKEVSFFENYESYKFYTSPDSSIVIYKIPPQTLNN